MIGNRQKTSRLSFEETKTPSRLSHELQDIPVNLAGGTVHREIHESEQDNVGVEAAHTIETGAEVGGRMVQSAHHTRSHRDTGQNPGYSSNPYSKYQQKRAIKQEYAAARHSPTTDRTVGNTVKTAGNIRKIEKFAAKNKHILLILAGILILLLFLLTAISSCSVLLQGGASVLSSAVYTGEDADMQSAETLYLEMEEELRNYLDNYESEHEYESYVFDLDEIGHNPYELTAMITAWNGSSWTVDEVDDILTEIFETQYV
ncbi:MAG: peptidase M23, partial [Clostridia bacterium]|nr:peptidase M23 [Clostridia bacterium]